MAAPTPSLPVHGPPPPDPERAEHIRLAGNDAFKARKFVEAVALYSRAIRADPTDPRSWCNRAQAYLYCDQPIYAYGDAYHVLEKVDAGNKKALLRLATAAQEMKLWTEAKETFLKLLPPDISPAAAMDPGRKLASFPEDLREVISRLKACLAGEAEVNRILREGLPGLSAEFIRATGAQVMYTDGMFSHPPQPARDGHGEKRNSDIVAAYAATEFKDFPVELRVVPGEGGFGVFAKSKIRRRDVLYEENPAIAACESKKRCYHCMLPCTDVPCHLSSSTCCDRKYCSSECERAAFELYHSPLCGNKFRVVEKHVERSATAAGRFPLVMIKLLGMSMKRKALGLDPRTASAADMDPYGFLLRGVPGSPFTAKTYIHHWKDLRRMLDLTQEGGEPLPMQTWTDLLLLLGTNAILEHPNLANRTFDTTGIVLMTAGCYFNHSCEPNAEFVYHMNSTGSYYKLVATRDIKAGKELTHFYEDPDQPVEARMIKLYGQHKFRCTCPKCKRELARNPSFDFESIVRCPPPSFM